MKITITETVKQERDIEVTFPIFRKHDLTGDYDSSIIYTRIDQIGNRLRAIDIHVKGDSEVNIEIDCDHGMNTGSGADYDLGRGQYESSQQEFKNAAKKASVLLNIALETD